MNALLEKIALLVSYFLPKSVKFYAMLDWMDQASFDDFSVESKDYLFTLSKQRK